MDRSLRDFRLRLAARQREQGSGAGGGKKDSRRLTPSVLQVSRMSASSVDDS